MPLRRRRDEGGTTYRMREKVFALGDDYWVENDAGERAFKVDGKVVRLRNTFVLEDPGGAEVYKVQKKLLNPPAHSDSGANVMPSLLMSGSVLG